MNDSVQQLADDFHDHRMRTSPTWAHMLGDYRFADQFEDGSRAAEDAETAALREFATRARAIPDDGLDGPDRVTRDIIAFDATTSADVAETHLAEFGVDPVFGMQVALGVTVAGLSLPTAEVAEAMVSKYRGIGRNIREFAERHREGVASGRTPTTFAVERAIEQVEQWLATPLDEDVLLTSTSEPPAGLDVEAWRGRLTQVIAAEVRPALAAFRDVLRDEVAPVMRPDEQCGLSWLPDGEQTYARLLARDTTTSLTAAEIHEIGLEQIASLEDEYRTLAPPVVGTDDLPSIYRALREDPALRHSSTTDIVAACEAAFAKARGVMPQWFDRLPVADCVVRATDVGAAAYYFPPADDGSRGGTFYINTADPAHWGRFELEALSYHEGIPGHHLQLAIAGELTEVPKYRKFTIFNAYAEGWGLYTERLADEMGLYTSPLERLGMLTMDSMRACRLVVDTGVHAMGWSRQRAVDYMVANCPLSVGGVKAEIDRYAVTPGQACGYMIGRLEILRIRREAQGRQGDAFDVKAFHNAVLDGGSVPLAVLDTVVRDRLP
ncbi:uncharacterized protein (DUF885 family) [Phycicoccus badiiscoriae]|uniref:Uncharacterized protein (DUF885 family) n=1 Tax=Pedococcus badiiscoriae TaxID=642776 RepID=A0A852WK06_9MICO|nr:DUF885 domain-containing protein [Pedococcus badiiscoriae]NYG07004.1 uncharacterized protein (DUF885 family) [Pedococcus badiiscoriae]